MTYLIGMSGPPRSGKDTIGAALGAMIEDKSGAKVQILALSTPMREVVYALLGVPYSVTHYELHKDDPQPAFGGKSIRWAMIDLSEQHIKPAYGKDFWAHSMLGRMWEPAPQVLIVTDMGFDAEVNALTDRFGLHNVLYPQIVRPGCDFSNDSRSYVGTPIRRISIINDGSVEDAALQLYGRIAVEYGWEFS